MAQFVAWQTAEPRRSPGEALLGGLKIMRCPFLSPAKFSQSMSRTERMQLYEELRVQPESPQAYLVETPGESETPAHFHRVPQYQVFVEGGGKLGRSHCVDAVAFHYTDEFTGYGPIYAAAEGLSYFTLRNFFDPGAEYLNQPDIQQKLLPSARRYLVAGNDRVRVSSAAALAARRNVDLDPVIDPHEDGLAAYMLRAGRGLEATGPDPATGGGQYWLVLNGSATHAGSDYIRNSLAWVSHSEQALTVKAGPRGVEIAVLQFPRALTSATTAST